MVADGGSRRVVVVESPAELMRIQAYLGSDYVVLARGSAVAGACHSTVVVDASDGLGWAS